jgi:N-acetyl-anhydromuramyl-L-alanine amidase AmpD
VTYETFKDTVGSARAGGTIIDWLIRLWAPGDHVARWGGGDESIIRHVTCRIFEVGGTPDENGVSPDAVEVWRRDGIMPGYLDVQGALDTLTAQQLYMLELDVPENSMHRSGGPAGPDTGRQDIAEMPPWYKSDQFDYQVRPARFWFEVEAREGELAGMRIHTIGDGASLGPEPSLVRPPPARARLIDDAQLGVRHVEIDWRPDWLRRGRVRVFDKDAQGKTTRSRIEPHVGPSGSEVMHGGKPTHIVLHNIGGDDIGSALTKFTSGKGSGGIHYLVDLDGHVIKLCPETHGVSHADESSWRGKKGLSRRSTGIEHATNEAGETYPPAQMRATLDLLRQLKAHFEIDGRNIVGHGEVRCIDPKEVPVFNADKTALAYDPDWGLALHPHARLTSCPGVRFPWGYFAARGVVPNPADTPLPEKWDETAYGGFFVSPDVPNLCEGDDDGREFWGGARQSHVHRESRPIRELYDDLRAIGYPIPIGAWNNHGGEFIGILGLAIRAFKARYMQDRADDADARQVDRETAATIKRVLAAYARGPV